MHERERRPVAAGALEVALERALEPAAVEQAGQRVALGAALELGEDVVQALAQPVDDDRGEDERRRAADEQHGLDGRLGRDQERPP